MQPLPYVAPPPISPTSTPPSRPPSPPVGCGRLNRTVKLDYNTRSGGVVGAAAREGVNRFCLCSCPGRIELPGHRRLIKTRCVGALDLLQNARASTGCHNASRSFLSEEWAKRFSNQTTTITNEITSVFLLLISMLSILSECVSAS